MPRALPTLLLLALALALALPAGARAGVWHGTVRFVDDGDTLDVDLAGDGTRAPRRVRIAGIQAMEQSVYASRRRAGDCHAVEATRRLEGLVRRARGRVRLTAEDPGSTSRGRLLRTVAVRLHGRWRDVGPTLLREGLALWWPTRAEPGPNRAYGRIAQAAIAARRGIFDPRGCGAGPSAESPLALRVNWDADGDDTANPDGEWVEIRNLDRASAVPLGGWHVRDSGLRRYTFPAHAVIAPGGTVTLHVGSQGDTQPTSPAGTGGRSAFEWGLDAPVFENVRRGPDVLGDGAYLFDPLGNVRAAMAYPCLVDCSDPLQGAVALSADREGRRESITLTNLTGAAAELDGHVLKSPPYSYHLEGAVLPAGGSLRIDVGGDPADDTALERHWGFAKPILRDGGDVALLATYTDITVACTAWGDMSC